jgi:hypothetical protein
MTADCRTLPNHFGCGHKSQNVLWSGLDSQDRYERNMRENRSMMLDLGYSDPGTINYHYNSQGFRDEEFDDRECLMALGGSMTEGVGVASSHIWCSVLSRLLSTHIWNLGIGACAMDTCFRMLDHYLHILKPKAVLLVKPPPARFELLTQHGTWDVYGPHMTVDRHDGFIKEYLLSDDNAEINDRKNCLAMTKLCDDAGIPIFFYEPEDIKIDGLARDLMHPGKQSHETFAHKVYNEMEESSWKYKNLL